MNRDNKTLLDFQTDWVILVNKAVNDYDSLSSDERIWFNIQALIDAVDNGGLISHYYNSGADHNKETIADLITIGFSDVADLLIKVNKLFPNSQPSTDLGERNEVINNWEDGKFDELLNQVDENFYGRENDLESKLINLIETKIKRA